MTELSLDELSVGESAEVCSLAAEGSMRRRLLDLGLTEGTRVRCVDIAPSGDPKAFDIRGAVTALRSSDCSGVRVRDKRPSAAQRQPSERVIALAGNPNVGKSTIFNALTGLRQHTGNWAGKTVGCAEGRYSTANGTRRLVDIPGTYSLMPHSAEEAVASDFIRSGDADAAVVVCDAGCLQRGLFLALQITELCSRTVICVNLCDEAARKGIKVDAPLLEARLGVPVVATSAHDKRTLTALVDAVERVLAEPDDKPRGALNTDISRVSDGGNGADNARAMFASVGGDSAMFNPTGGADDARTGGDRAMFASVGGDRAMFNPTGGADDARTGGEPLLLPEECRFEPVNTPDYCDEQRITALYRRVDKLCEEAVSHSGAEKKQLSARIRRLTAYPLMIALLLLIFWLTITGANYPSQLLSEGLGWVGERLSEGLKHIGAPEWLRAPLIDGAWTVLAWVVSVMLPPMAIFFPLFTLLEDAGYLPRAAFCLDSTFRKCRACGKQALTMAMGFGCNAVGVTGCRIIDSPRERLIAILTNSLVPCNGRFPTMIALLTAFFIGTEAGLAESIGSAALLTAVIVSGVLATFLASRILSATLLKGEPSSFTLELPPYRRPQVGRVIVRSVLDRTLYVLGRAAVVAAPAGLVIWIFANITVGDATILTHCTAALDPFARLLGLDGVILMAFILGIPANEIVLPIIIMTYMAQGSLTELDTAQMHELFVANGWTPVTAICTILFSLMHWPCSTTLLTVRKETGGWRWTAAAFIIPTVMGMAVCAAVAGAARMFG